MIWESLNKRLLSTAGRGAARFTLPSLVLEIEPGFVTAARLETSARPPRRLTRIGVRQFEASVVQPHVSRPNIANPERLHQAVREVMEAVGNGVSRFGLVVPDGAARVAPLSFETLPDDPKQAEALVQWRMREALPFAAEEARLSYQVMSRETNHVEVLAVAARTSVLEEYKAALKPLDGGPVLILPTTLALLPLLPEAEPGGQLLVHVCSRWITSVVVAGSRLCSWRTRGLNSTGAEDLAREVAAEAARTLAGARDHLSVNFARAWLCARPPAAQEMVSVVAGAISQGVENLPGRTELGLALPSDERPLFEDFGQTFAGLAANAA